MGINSVSLPGYNHVQPGVGLAEALKAGSDIASGFSNRAKTEAETEGANIANKQAQLNQQAQQSLMQQNSDPDSALSMAKKDTLNARIGVAEQTGLVPPKGLDALKARIPGMRGIDIDMLDQGGLKDILTTLPSDQIKGINATKAANIKVAPQNVKNQNAANDLVDGKLAPFENSVQSANSVLEIIKRIQNGELKSTPTLAQDLATKMASTFNNGKAATVSGTEGSKLSSLAGDTAQRWGYIDGKAVNTITPDQLNQMAKDFGALKDNAADGYNSFYSSYRLGMDPSVLPGIDKRVNSFTNSNIKSSPSARMDAAKQKGPAVDSDLSKMTPKQLQEYIKHHGG